MNILCINQFFWPDLAPTSQLLTDLARTLASDGNQVTILCSASVYAGTNDSRTPSGVRVIRVPSLRFSRGIAGRLITYATFFVHAVWHALKSGRPDLVVTMTTPPLVSLIGTLLKKLRGSRHFIWEMDLYPEIAVDLGVVGARSWITKVVSWIADLQRRSADGVIVLGECMKERLTSRGLESAKIFVVENWANGTIFYPRQQIGSGGVSIIYPGNFGLGHDYRTLQAALAELPDDGRVGFTFVGGGPRYENLMDWCTTNGCRIVTFKGYCNPEDLASKEMPLAQIGLVLQDSRSSGSIVPSKIYPLMAAGHAILYIGPAHATPARIINRFQCGWHVEPGHSEQLVSLLIRLAESPEEVRIFGEHARNAFCENFDLSLGTAHIMSILSGQSKATSGAGKALRAAS